MKTMFQMFVLGGESGAEILQPESLTAGLNVDVPTGCSMAREMYLIALAGFKGDSSEETPRIIVAIDGKGHPGCLGLDEFRKTAISTLTAVLTSDGYGLAGYRCSSGGLLIEKFPSRKPCATIQTEGGLSPFLIRFQKEFSQILGMELGIRRSYTGSPNEKDTRSSNYGKYSMQSGWHEPIGSGESYGPEVESDVSKLSVVVMDIVKGSLKKTATSCIKDDLVHLLTRPVRRGSVVIARRRSFVVMEEINTAELTVVVGPIHYEGYSDEQFIGQYTERALVDAICKEKANYVISGGTLKEQLYNNTEVSFNVDLGDGSYPLWTSKILLYRNALASILGGYISFGR